MNLENYYFKFFNNTKCAVFILKDSLIHYANPSSLELFGYTNDEILSLHPSELSPMYQENGEISIIKADEMIRKAIKDGGNTFEWLHIKKDKTVFWTEITLTPVKHKNSISIVALIKDISKRKTYEKELSLILKEQDFLLKNIADFVYKLNKKQELIYISDSIKNITDYSKEEWISNYKDYIVNNDNFKKITKERKEILKSKLKLKKHNLEITDKRGRKIILELLESYYSENGKEEIIGVGKDITEKIRNEMMLLKSQKMELISKISSGLVHEFNNNLSIIQGNVELLKRKVLSNIEENSLADKYMNNIKLATKKANETLNRLLSITNNQSQTMQYLDLNELVLDVFSIIRNSFSKSVELNLSLFEGEITIKGDFSQIKHMLLNILINSYQAIQKKSSLKGEITLKTDKIIKNNKNYILMEITDNGTGIPQNIIPMIFEPFFTTKDAGNDLGLGLTSSKNIAQSHGGFIEVDSRENIGTKVKIYLPEKEETKENIKDKLQEEKIKDTYTILLIDDEPLIITTAKAILEEFGHNVMTALNGISGINTFKTNKEKIDLVILDMDMPNMSGREVFYELKKIDSKVNVIISSGYKNDERVKEILKNGVKDFLSKPYGISDFIGKINRILN